ncbi:MAG: AmmeMemoRadiSam system radical SAM enzyme [Clostridiales bacterium]|nr:AmmeMemoRadiSam system radical SAM enzyme [Clostridiales bacterium]
MNHNPLAMFQTQHEDGTVTCTLCPHYCHLKESEPGKCRTRYNEGGKLLINNYGKVVSYAYDPIEKKPLNRFYPGHTIFSIGTSGCNFDCDFCQNHDLVHFNGQSPVVSDDLILRMAQDQSSIGIAFTYNEPTVWYEYVYDLSRKSHELGLKNVLVTNGFINPDPLEKLLPYIDAMNIDLKAYTEKYYSEICSGHLNPVLKTIETSAKHTHVEITTLLIDGLNTSDDELHALCSRVANIDPEIPIHLSRYFPAHRMNIPKTRLETMVRAKHIAEKYLKYVYVGNCFIDE